METEIKTDAKEPVEWTAKVTGSQKDGGNVIYYVDFTNGVVVETWKYVSSNATADSIAKWIASVIDVLKARDTSIGSIPVGVPITPITVTPSPADTALATFKVAWAKHLSAQRLVAAGICNESDPEIVAALNEAVQLYDPKYVGAV